MKAQRYAVEIDTYFVIFLSVTVMVSVEVNSDCIKAPYLSMTQRLAYLYVIHPDKGTNIDKFVESFEFYSDMRLDDILSFDTNEKVIDKCTIQIEKDSGLEQVQYMISEFRKVVE